MHEEDGYGHYPRHGRSRSTMWITQRSGPGARIASKDPRGEPRDKEVPTISIDYMYVHPGAERGEEREKGMPLLVIRDDRAKMIFARGVPQKGQEGYAVGALKSIIEQLAYKKIALKRAKAKRRFDCLRTWCDGRPTSRSCPLWGIIKVTAAPRMPSR